MFAPRKVRERQAEVDLEPPGPVHPPEVAGIAEAGPSLPPGLRPSSGRGAAAFIVMILVAAAVFVVIRRHQPAAPTSSVPVSSGTLVYAAKGTAGSSMLFLWDLKSGSVSAGPSVPGLDALAPADPLNEGWIGVITRSPSDVLTASTLWSLDPDATIRPLVKGRLVAFDSIGASVVGIPEGPTTRGCRHALVISEREVFTGRVHEQYSANTCARVLTLARARGTTYLTRQRGHRISVDYVGVGRLHDILADHALISVSAASDMLVVSSRDMGFPEATPPVLGASGPASIFFRGIGAPDPIPFAQGTDALALGDVLAWSPDPTLALVVGRLGAESGIFELAVGPGESPRQPTFVAATRGPVWASYADQTTAFVSMGGQIYVLRDDKLELVSLPPGAPTPIGPVIWVR